MFIRVLGNLILLNSMIKQILVISKYLVMCAVGKRSCEISVMLFEGGLWRYGGNVKEGGEVLNLLG